MILNPRSDEEYDGWLRQLDIINLMRRPLGARRNYIDDTPWMVTRTPRPEYL